ncbi:MAG: gephyrin-like molybdotransferase Glp [Pseudomonadota bacterium]
MISVEAALAEIAALVGPVTTEPVALTDAAGRVLAEPVTAKRDQPPFAASAMDGYAVRAADMTVGARLRVIGEAVAGCRYDGPVGPGETVRIFTGAPLPDGADTILIQEDAERASDGTIRVTDVPTQHYVRPAGGDFQRGAMLEAPRRLAPADLALAAAMNVPDLTVARRPQVALIATGNELVPPGEMPDRDQIIGSNIFALKALVEAEGAAARLLPIARDSAESLSTTLGLARSADLILTTGGASVGDHDLVSPVAQSMGMDLSFHKVAMRPGKPLMAGRLGHSILVGLPGNPVSSIVCGMIFVRPLLRAMQGLPAEPLPRSPAILGEDLSVNGPREHYMRARLEDGRIRAFDRQDSSLLTVLAQANALLVRPPHDPARCAGDTVEMIPLG